MKKPVFLTQQRESLINVFKTGLYLQVKLELLSLIGLNVVLQILSPLYTLSLNKLF